MSKSMIIVGGGMGGYGAAIRAAQLGAKVDLIEKDVLGGTCLNRGCIPTKTLLQSANLLHLIKKSQTFGITAQEVSLDFGAVLKRKEAVINRLVSGITSLMRKNKIRVIKGTGAIIDPKTVKVLENDEEIKGDSIVIATGAQPLMIPIKGISEPGVISSDGALTMPELPSSLFVIGGGVIGIEFAQIYHKMGIKVSIGEAMPHLLPNVDTEIAQMLEEILIQDGIEVFTDAKVTSIETTDRGENRVSFVTERGEEERLVAKVLVTVGRQPYTEKLGVEKLGTNMEKGRIIVDERMETNISGIYAVGDVVGRAMLAHVALSEGICAVENAMGLDSEIRYDAIPSCIYTSPEIASVGLTEEEARRHHSDIKVSKFPFAANGRALILDDTAGMVKIITGSYGEILGATIIGPEATELIAEVTLAMHLEATSEEVASCIHAHPTLSEVISEATMRTEGRAIHI
ncbi:dihydrolipoyl dehydrogenase [Chloroflexota bacterium]